MAERVGFQTHDGPMGHNGFRDRPVQPLRHLSVGQVIIIIGFIGQRQSFYSSIVSYSAG